MKTMMKYEETPKFARDIKKLLKKFPSLREDLETSKQYDIELFHLQNIDKRGILKIEGAGNNKQLQFFKVKKFACKYLKGSGVNSGIRITYAYNKEKKKITFLEMYYKGNKENEDYERIKSFTG